MFWWVWIFVAAAVCTALGMAVGFWVGARMHEAFGEHR